MIYKQLARCIKHQQRTSPRADNTTWTIVDKTLVNYLINNQDIDQPASAIRHLQLSNCLQIYLAT